MADKLERIYTVPLGEAYEAIRNKRAGKAVKILRKFVGRHMKADEENVVLSMALNEYIWKRSIQKPPRKVKVRLIKEDEKVRAYLADEKIEETKKEDKKKEEKSKEEPGKNIEEKKKEEIGLELKEEKEKKPEELKEKLKEVKKEQKHRAQLAMAEKEAEEEIKDVKENRERARKQKLSHGKEIASETG